MIPRIIHFVWLGSDIPHWFTPILKKFKELNPDYRVETHGEEALSERYSLPYGHLSRPSSKSNLLRLSLLREHGGWYFDCDFVPIRPIDDIVADYGNIPRGFFLARQRHDREVSPSHHVSNGVIGAAPDSRAWAVVDEEFAKVPGPPYARVFGPDLMTRVAGRCGPAISVGQPKEFYPFPFGSGDVPVKAYRRWLASGLDGERLFTAYKKIPYAFHLWSQGRFNG